MLRGLMWREQRARRAFHPNDGALALSDTAKRSGAPDSRGGKRAHEAQKRNPRRYTASRCFRRHVTLQKPRMRREHPVCPRHIN